MKVCTAARRVARAVNQASLELERLERLLKAAGYSVPGRKS